MSNFVPLITRGSSNNDFSCRWHQKKAGDLESGSDLGKSGLIFKDLSVLRRHSVSNVQQVGYTTFNTKGTCICGSQVENI
jgi:hypothetical protein